MGAQKVVVLKVRSPPTVRVSPQRTNTWPVEPPSPYLYYSCIEGLLWSLIQLKPYYYSTIDYYVGQQLY